MRKHSDQLKMVFLALMGCFTILTVAIPTNTRTLDVATSAFNLTSSVLVHDDGAASVIQTTFNTLVQRGETSPSNWQLKLNSLAFGGPAFACFAVRMINKLWIQRLMQLEEYMMCVTMFLYISLLTLINVSAHYATNLYPESESAAILSDPAQISGRIIGSKIVIALEQCMLFSTWGVKLCIWMFLRRCCRQLPKYTLCLWILFAYIIVGLVVIELTYYTAFCQPFSQYYAVPVTNDQCATYASYSITQACFNISSDAALIGIPVWMVCNIKLPWKRRFILFIVFSMGVFTIVAAILNKYFNFRSPLTTTYQLWYIREASVAMCVGNIICTWQLIQRVFKVRSFDNKHAGIDKQPEMGANMAHQNERAQLTIGGTPRIPDGTPDPNSGKSLWGKLGRKDPDASLFSTFRGTVNDDGRRSRLETRSGTPPPTDGSGYTSDTYVNDKGPGVGVGIFLRPSQDDHITP